MATLDGTVRLGDVRDFDADSAARLATIRAMTVIDLVGHIDAMAGWLVQRQYRKTYPIGSARRHVLIEMLIDYTRHYLRERGGADASARDFYMDVLANAYAEAAKNLRAQVKFNKAAR